MSVHCCKAKPHSMPILFCKVKICFSISTFHVQKDPVEVLFMLHRHLSAMYPMLHSPKMAKSGNLRQRAAAALHTAGLRNKKTQNPSCAGTLKADLVRALAGGSLVACTLVNYFRHSVVQVLKKKGMTTLLTVPTTLRAATRNVKAACPVGNLFVRHSFCAPPFRVWSYWS